MEQRRRIGQTDTLCLRHRIARQLKFGYLQFGVNASIPLSMMTKGAWEVHGGIDFFVFPSDRKVTQVGDDEAIAFKPVLSFGFSATY